MLTHFDQAEKAGTALPLGGLPGAIPLSLTRPSNTGLICQDSDVTLGIDYLTFVFPIPDESLVRDILGSCDLHFLSSTEYHWDQGRFIGRQFANWASSPHGMVATWNLPGQNGDLGSLRLCLSGKVLERISVPHLIPIMRRWLCLLGAKCNRIDLKADDYSRSMLPEYLIAAYKAGDYTGFQKAHYQEDLSGSVYESGWTLYLGRRTSDRFTRYYNAKPLHAIDAFRWETEYKNEIANVIAHAIAKCDDEELLANMISGLLAGNISFISRAGEARASRCSPLPFWSAWLLKFSEPIRFGVAKIELTIERSISWVERSVSATLAMISHYAGADKLDYLKHLIKIGREKMGSRHYAILESSDREPIKQYPGEDSHYTIDNFPRFAVEV